MYLYFLNLHFPSYPYFIIVGYYVHNYSFFCTIRMEKFHSKMVYGRFTFRKVFQRMHTCLMTRSQLSKHITYSLAAATLSPQRQTRQTKKTARLSWVYFETRWFRFDARNRDNDNGIIRDYWNTYGASYTGTYYLHGTTKATGSSSSYLAVVHTVHVYWIPLKWKIRNVCYWGRLLSQSVSVYPLRQWHESVLFELVACVHFADWHLIFFFQFQRVYLSITYTFFPLLLLLDTLSLRMRIVYLHFLLPTWCAVYRSTKHANAKVY